MAVTEFRSREAQTFLEGLRRPDEVQRDVLLRQILAPNVDSELGREAGFAKIATVADYRRALPVSTYEGFRERIDRIVAHGEQGLLTTEPVKRFFMTSGSTAASKYIPVTSSFVRAKSRAFGIYWAGVFAAHPAAKAGRMVTNFSDSGSPKRTAGGLPCSSESAYWAGVTRATQLAARPIIPKSVARIADPDARYYAIARILVEEDFAVIMTLNPSTIVLLFETMARRAASLVDDLRSGGLAAQLDVGDDVREYVTKTYGPNPARADVLAGLVASNRCLAHEVWPGLSLAICWRSPMLRPYLDLLTPHLGPVAGRDYIMMASEGIMAIPWADGGSGGPVAVGVHFYEFIPEDQLESPSPDVLLPEELEIGRTYVVVLTNGAGLYRYNIGDVVRVTGFFERTPCIEFLHRAGATSSLTGEKLTEGQVTAAVSATAAELGLEVESFTLAPAPAGFPRYAAWVEFRGTTDPEALEAFPTVLDRALAEHNSEYGGKRSSRRLGAPELWVVAPGQYDARRRRRLDSGTSDSQIKPTHLTRDPSWCEPFEIVGRYGAG